MHEADLQFLLLVAVAAIIFLVVKYYRRKHQFESQLNELRSQIGVRVQQEFDAWKSRQLDAERSQLRQTAQAAAAVDLDSGESRTKRALGSTPSAEVRP